MINAKLYMVEFVGDYGTENVVLYNNKTECIRDIANSNCKTYCIAFAEHGSTFRRRHDYIRSIAIDWSYVDQSFLSLDEISEVSHFFEKTGEKYGLLREFQENAII